MSFIWDTSDIYPRLGNVENELKQEISDRQADSAALGAAVSQEAYDRRSDVALLDASILREANSRATADAAEASARATEVARLDAALNKEIGDRISADAAESSARTAADAGLSAAVTQEISNRSAADSAEAAARVAADNWLDARINQEINDRMAADAAINSVNYANVAGAAGGIWGDDGAGQSAGVAVSAGWASYLFLSANYGSNTVDVVLIAAKGGGFRAMHPMDQDKATITLGVPDNRWGTIYAASGTISTSDERCKTVLKDGLSDALLRAWGRIGFAQYRLNEALEQKGDQARIHTGLIAQRVEEAFLAEGLNPRDYALFCHDSWDSRPMRPEKRDSLGRIVEPAVPAREAGERYALRYEECLCLEAAYLRRRVEELEKRVASLEAASV